MSSHCYKLYVYAEWRKFNTSAALICFCPNRETLEAAQERISPPNETDKGWSSSASPRSFTDEQSSLQSTVRVGKCSQTNPDILEGPVCQVSFMYVLHLCRYTHFCIWNHSEEFPLSLMLNVFLISPALMSMNTDCKVLFYIKWSVCVT